MHENALFHVNVLVFPVQMQYNMHVIKDNNKTMCNLRKDLQLLLENVDKIGAMHRKMAQKQLKKVKNLRNSWGYSLHMHKNIVDLQQQLLRNTEILTNKE